MGLGRVGIPTGVHLVLERSGEILLMRRAGTGFFDGLFSLPGGHVEPGESVVEAARREALEELGLSLAGASFVAVGVMHRLSDTNRIDFFLRVEDWLGSPVIGEPGKCDALGWYAPLALPAETVPYVRRALLSEQGPPWILEDGWEAGSRL